MGGTDTGMSGGKALFFKVSSIISLISRSLMVVNAKKKHHQEPGF